MSAALVSIARDINRLYAEAESHALSAVEAAISCGKLLTEAKAKVGHGNFGKWIVDNFDGSYRTAAKYMQVAKKLPANVPRGADLSLRGALELVANPKPPVSIYEEQPREKHWPQECREWVALMREGGELLRSNRDELDLRDCSHEFLCEVQDNLVGLRDEVFRIRLTGPGATPEKYSLEAALALQDEVIDGIENAIAEFLEPTPIEQEIQALEDVNELLKTVVGYIQPGKEGHPC